MLEEIIFDEEIENPTNLSDDASFDFIDETEFLSDLIFQTCPYLTWASEASEYLFVVSRGGTGHITAMKAIQELYPETLLRQYEPVSRKSKPSSMTSTAIKFAAQCSRLNFVKQNLANFGIITIPDTATLKARMQRYERKGSVYTIDMLLDVVSTGYQCAAIWDEFQINNRCDMLAQLVALQGESDKQFYHEVNRYFYQLLVRAHYEGKPYRRIISTQVLCLPALCDAVIQYNNWLEKCNDTAPRVVIEQFMTDLPTCHASHYFKAFERLDKMQQTQISLHAVNLEKKVLAHFLGDKVHFKNVYQIDPKNNPMVRQAFKTVDNTPYFESSVTLICNDGSEIKIAENEKIATIMLGGQAGNDSVSYILPFLRNGIDRVFVFGGDNPTICEAVRTLLLQPAYSGRIILLPSQEADFIAGLETRSLRIVKRGGGLSCFEVLAMAHHPKQRIFIHYADSCEDYDCGIEWENGNVDMLIDLLTKQGVCVEKTKPNEIEKRLQQLADLVDENIETSTLKLS